METSASAELDQGFRLAAINGRGITSRNPNEGGKQKHELASRYQKWADIVSIEWPRVATNLRELAIHYNDQANRENRHAEEYD